MYNDIKVYSVEEKTLYKEVHVNNRTGDKMISWKWFLQMILEFGLVVAFMTSNVPRKKRVENEEADISNKTEKR